MNQKLNEIAKILPTIGLGTRHIFDITSVYKNIRPYGILHFEKKYLSIVEKSMDELSLSIFSKKYLYKEADPNSREGILSLAKNSEEENFCELWFLNKNNIDLNRSLSWDELHSRTGYYLSYPDCCVGAWEKYQAQNIFYEKYIYETKRGFWQNNRLASIFYPDILMLDYFPCSLDCPHASQLADKIFSVINTELDADLLNNSFKWMKAVYFVNQEYLFASPEWIKKDDRISINQDKIQKVKLQEVAKMIKRSIDKIHLIPFEHYSGVAFLDIMREDEILATFKV